MENDDPLAAIRADVEAEMAAEAAKAGDADEKPAKRAAAEQGGEEGDNTDDEAARGEGEEAEAEDEGDEGKPEPKKAAAKPRDWKRARINELTAKNREKDAENERLKAKIAELEAGARGDADEGAEEEAEAAEETEKPKPRQAAKPGKTEAEIRAEIEAKMRAENAEADFTKRSNDAFDAGVKEYGEEEFAEARDTLVDVGLNAKVLAAVLETDAPAKVLWQLSQNPEEASRIFRLSSIKMAIEMDRIATKRASGRKVSEAPAPIKPVGAKGGDDDNNLTPTASDAAVDKYLAGFHRRQSEKWN